MDRCCPAAEKIGPAQPPTLDEYPPAQPLPGLISNRVVKETNRQVAGPDKGLPWPQPAHLLAFCLTRFIFTACTELLREVFLNFLCFLQIILPVKI